MHDSGNTLIPVPIPLPGKTKSLIPVPIPVPLGFLDSGSDSDSSKKLTDSGIDSDSGIGIVHHWYSEYNNIINPLLHKHFLCSEQWFGSYLYPRIIS